ncbi:DNA-packaging protein [Youxingia wuxianensis]|uniref:Uncharacterized protein n=1 Tax=Youxingia wuxianensis TaxID=2763678 RepID=A0A926ENW4_9FIRM|nr:DNA-packaging protein [Youxingia wuxianensis]MBC8586061.1 hypothetical protein [Youxingia wuxianensis]
MAGKESGARPRGNPKRFQSGEELIELYQQFCIWVKENNFQTIPSQTRFCEWLTREYKATDRRTIYNALNKYFPNIKKEFEKLQADTMAEGAMIGRYNPTMTIFALKNWCEWKDKQEVEQQIIGVSKFFLSDNEQAK